MTSVILSDELSLEQALQKFNRKVYNQKSSRWYKRRYGYYEKPSTLKRKRQKMRKIVLRRHYWFNQMYEYQDNQSQLWLKIELVEQFSRTGKNAVGH